MSNKKENPKNSDSHVSLFEEQKRVKKSAANSLIIAKEQEKQKLDDGFKYHKIDNKTMVLKKNVL
jgi:hypothetical protein